MNKKSTLPRRESAGAAVCLIRTGSWWRSPTFPVGNPRSCQPSIAQNNHASPDF
nr:MAG TPA: hypothetical protein [Caudoviricetes sp.]